jgi:hypothetical protein
MEDLLRSQSCSLSRVLSSQSARTSSTLSTKVFDQFIDLTKDPVVEEDDEPVPPCLLACVDYSSDDDDVVVVDDEEEEPVGRSIISPSVGDSIFSALDIALGPSPVVFSSQQGHCKKRDIREYNSRPSNWTEIARYYKIHRNASGTIFHFGLKTNKDFQTKQYWITTFGRWAKDCDTEKWLQQSGRLPVYGTKIDKQLVDVVQNYADHAVPMTNLMLRMHLITLLTDDNRTDILDAIAEPEESLTKTKKYRFTDQWALRFYRRHKLSSRVATTKLQAIKNTPRILQTPTRL